MTDKKLLDYVLEDKQDTILNDGLGKYLKLWIATCKRFKDFVCCYKDKIRKKIKGIKKEKDDDERKRKLEDLRFELEIPYLILLDDRFEVEYEKYGTKTKGPDFSVIFNNLIEFNIEVTHFREHYLNERYNKWEEEVESEIRAIPSNFHFILDVNPVKPYLIIRLESAKEKIIQYMKDFSQEVDQEVDEIESPIPGFERELKLTLLNKARKGQTYFRILRFEFQTGKEYLKLGNVLFGKKGKLKQMRPGMINILIINTTSANYDEIDIQDGQDEIVKIPSCKDEKSFVEKGFRGRKDFLQHWKRLSGILSRLFGGEKSRIFWCSEQADHQIPEPIRQYLKGMTSLF